MKALAAVLLVLALPVQAQDTGTPLAPVVLEAGAAAPFKGLLLSEALAIADAKRLANAEAQVKDYEAQNGQHVSAPLVIGWTVVAVAVGAVIATGACFASKACR